MTLDTIKHLGKTSFQDSLKVVDFNKTTRYMLGALELGAIEKHMKLNNFIGAFLDDEQVDKLVVNALYLVFQSPDLDSESYIKMETLMKKHPFYIEDYIVFVEDSLKFNKVYIFQVPRKWLNVFIKFKQSKFSEFDKEYIDKFPPFIRKPDGTIVPNRIYQIITKDPEYRQSIESYLGVEIDQKQELESILEPEQEIYRYDREAKVHAI